MVGLTGCEAGLTEVRLIGMFDFLELVRFSLSESYAMWLTMVAGNEFAWKEEGKVWFLHVSCLYVCRWLIHCWRGTAG